MIGLIVLVLVTGLAIGYLIMDTVEGIVQQRELNKVHEEFGLPRKRITLDGKTTLERWKSR